MSKSPERRKHPRKRVVVRSRIAGDEVSAECETVDLSVKGLSCWTERSLPLFVKVRITLMIPSPLRSANHRNSPRPVECEGIVIRSDQEKDPGDGNRYHTAIFFNHIADDAMDMIQRYVASHKH